MYAATPPESRASSAPLMSVTGCEYTPMVIGRSSRAMTVNGSWWRPDDLQAEHALRRRAKNGCGDHHGDDRGRGQDRGELSDAAGQD